MSLPFMPRSLLFAPAVVAGCWIAGVPAAASADQLVAYTTTSVNMRGGPDTSYQVIQQVPERTRIVVDGCLQSLDWCQVEYQQRGWMSSDYIQAYYQGTYYPLMKVASELQVPVVTFDTAQQDQSGAQQEQSNQTSSGGTNVDATVFYERLAPYGSWVELSGSYVWVPTRVSGDWRPYQHGRWVDTDQYGWMWVSSEPFGWATYHYGRWGYSKRIGWFWVPGSRWAPAWVAWRSSGSYLAWAPLPPEENTGVDVTINVNINEVPNYYWVVVPTARFLSTDINTVVVNQQQAVTYLQQAQPLGTVQIQGQTVINNVVNVQTIQSQTQQQVVVHQVSTVQDPQAKTQVTGNTVQIFAPQLQNGATTAGPTKPPQVAPLTQVEQQSQTKGQAGDQPATDNLLQSTGQQPAGNGNEQNGGQQPDGSANGQQPQTNAPANGQPQPTNGQQPTAGQQQQPTNGQQQTQPLTNGQQPSTSGNQNCLNGAQSTGNCPPANQPSSGKNGSSAAQPPSSSTTGGASGNEPPPPPSTTPSTSQPPAPGTNGTNGSSNQPTAPSTSPKALQPSAPSSGSSQGTTNEPPPPTSTKPTTSQPPSLQGTTPNGQQSTSPQDNTPAPGTTKRSAPPKSLQQSCPKGTVLQSDGSCAPSSNGSSSNGSSSKSNRGSSGAVQPNEPPPPPSNSSTSGSGSSSRSGSPAGAGLCPKGTTLQADGSCAAGPPTKMTGEPKTRGSSSSDALAPSSGSGGSMNGVPSQDVGTGQPTDQTTTQSLSPGRGLQPAPGSRHLQRQGCPGGTAQLPDGSCGQVLQQQAPLQPQPLPQ